jgi:hypothetical protein
VWLSVILSLRNNFNGSWIFNWDFPPITVQLRDKIIIGFDGTVVHVDYSPVTHAARVRISNGSLIIFPLFYPIPIIWSPWFDLGHRHHVCSSW